MRIVAPIHVPHTARPQGQRGEVRQGRGPERRSMGSAQASMLDMADDASGLLAALRSRRIGDTETGLAGSGLPWLEMILEENLDQRMAALGKVLDEGGEMAAMCSAARGVFADPSDLVAAFNAMLAQLPADSAKRRRLEAMLAAVMAEADAGGAGNGRQIRAGLNVAVQARKHARRLNADRRHLRATYRHFLAADLDPTLLYELWVQQYGFEHRLGVVTFVEQALAADMYALDPSCARREFGDLLAYARRLTLLRSVDGQLMACPWQTLLRDRTDLTAEAWVAGVLATLRSGASEAKPLHEMLAKTRHALAAGEKASLLVSLRRVLSRLPHDLWVDSAAQVETLDALDDWIGMATRSETNHAAPGHKVIA